MLSQKPIPNVAPIKNSIYISLIFSQEALTLPVTKRDI